MKKRNILKNYLKIGVLLFGVSILLYNCEKDFQHESHVEESEIEDGILSKKPLKDFANDIAFKKAQSFLEINTDQINQVNFRIKETRLTAKDSSSNNFISVNTKNVARITRPTYTSYTFSINQLKQEDNSFRNLIVNVSENKTTAFINTYIPDEGYLQRKLTDKNTNFSGKVYFTEYTENLSKLLKNYKLKPLLSKTNTEVCIAEFRVLMWSCNARLHWPFDTGCKLEGSARAGKSVEVYERCYGGGTFDVNYGNFGDLLIEDTIGGGPGGPGTTPIDNIDDDCGGDGYTRNFEGECVKYDCIGDDKKFNEITKKCECKDNTKIINGQGKCVVKCETTVADLQKVFNNTNSTKLQQIADFINKHGKDFGIDTDEKMQHFISQSAHEATNPINGIEFDAFEENLNYRWAKLGQNGYWQKYFNPISNPTEDPNKENPNDYKKNSTSDFVNVQKFANYVYDDANRDPNYKMGNSNFGDGYKFRGRGIFQLTGKYNYQKFTTFYQSKYDSNTDFTTNPDLVATNIEIAVISALWFYENNVNSDSITSDTSVNEVTKKINGGKKGLKHRKSLFNKTKIHINCK